MQETGAILTTEEMDRIEHMEEVASAIPISQQAGGRDAINLARIQIWDKIGQFAEAKGLPTASAFEEGWHYGLDGEAIVIFMFRCFITSFYHI